MISGQPTGRNTRAPERRSTAIAWRPQSALRRSVLLPILLLAVCCAWTTACAPIPTTPKAVAKPTAPSTPTPAPTYTAAPPRSLAWQPRQPATAPAPHLGNSYDNPIIAFSQADSMLAYECVAPADGTDAPAAVWVTHDAARSWRHVGALATGDAIASCAIVPDTTDPTLAIAEIVPSGFTLFNPQGTFHTLATRDGGATWEAIAGPYDRVLDLATYRSVTYALFARHVMSATPLVSALAVSTDGLRTWTPLAPPFAGDPTSAFWLNPATGALLAQTGPYGGLTPALSAFATSTDGGAHWSTLPGAPFSLDSYVVQRPLANQPWHICAVHNQPIAGTGAVPPHLLTCTADSGKTWEDRLGPQLYAEVVGIANDGSVLLEFGTGVPCAMDRLTPSGSDWQQLGQTPVAAQAGCGSVEVVAGGGHGTLWYLPLPYSSDQVPSAAQRLIYAAPYA